jgi:hypothetical protein
MNQPIFVPYVLACALALVSFDNSSVVRADETAGGQIHDKAGDAASSLNNSAKDASNGASKNVRKAKRGVKKQDASEAMTPEKDPSTLADKNLRKVGD